MAWFSYIPWVIDLTKWDKVLDPKGKLSGVVELTSFLVTVALAFYTALWLYWSVKRWLHLPQRQERRMLDALRAIPNDDAK